MRCCSCVFVPLTDASQTAALKHNCQVQTSQTASKQWIYYFIFCSHRCCFSCPRILLFPVKCSLVLCFTLSKQSLFYGNWQCLVLYSEFDNNMHLGHSLFWGKCPYFLKPGVPETKKLSRAASFESQWHFNMELFAYMQMTLTAFQAVLHYNKGLNSCWYTGVRFKFIF